MSCLQWNFLGINTIHKGGNGVNKSSYTSFFLESQFFIPKVVIKNTHIVADDTSLGALQPSKASPHRPRHWNISMGILIVQASVIDDNIDTKIQMLQLENTQDRHSGKYW